SQEPDTEALGVMVRRIARHSASPSTMLLLYSILTALLQEGSIPPIGITLLLLAPPFHFQRAFTCPYSALPRRPSSTLYGAAFSRWYSKRARSNHCTITVAPSSFVSCCGSPSGMPKSARLSA